MSKKLDPDATSSHKTLLLFSLLLFSGRRHYLSDLAERFTCTKPTVLRLMQGIERSGVAAIETGIEERRRWYQLKSLPGRPQIVVSRDEVEKLALCRDLLKFLLPDGMESVISGSIGKIAVLMDDVRERGAATAVKAARRPKGRLDYTPFQQHIDCLLKAVPEHAVCAVTYKTPNKEPRVFEVVPLRLMVEEEEMTVEGWRVTDKGTPQIRFPVTLAIQRIHECIVTRRKLKDCPPLPEARGVFGLSGAEEAFRVRIAFCEEHGEYIRERVWSKDQEIKELPDGGVELSFTAGSEQYLLSWLWHFGSGAELLEPVHLRDRIWDEVRELWDMYAPEEAENAG